MAIQTQIIDSDASGEMLYSDTRHQIGSFTRDLSLATGTQEITGLTKQAKVIIFYACVDGAVGKTCWGFDLCDDSNSHSIADTYQRTANTYEQGTGYSIVIAVSGSDTYYGKVSTTSSNSFTMSWLKSGSPTGTAYIKWKAFF